MNSEQILQRIGDVGIVPVIRADNVDHTLHAVEALVEGGLRIVEITMTVPDALRAIATVVKLYGDSILIGAGTVITGDDAERCVDAGAQFLVSPGVSVPVLQAARKRHMLAIPGAFTPTEIIQALAEDAHVVKIFPCNSAGGPAHLKALRGPFPKLPMIPTGGVNATNAAQYLEAGAFALGAGGDLVDGTALRNGEMQRVTRAARDFIAAVTAARGTRSATDSKFAPNPVV